MKWMLILGFLALVGCADEDESGVMPNRVVIGGATGASGALLSDALDRAAQLGGGVSVEFHDEKGSFELSVVAPTEDSCLVGCGYPTVEVLFNDVAMSGESVGDDELVARINALVKAAELLRSTMIIEVSAIESTSSADAVKYLRLISECGIGYFKLDGQFLPE